MGCCCPRAWGIAGAAGALAAPLAGRIADRRGPGVVTRLGAGLPALSFAIMAALPWLGAPLALALLAITAVGFDMGVQGSLIGHQSIVYGLERSRLNAVLFVVVFIGMATGAALGATLLAWLGWPGVTALATASALAALAVRVLRSR